MPGLTPGLNGLPFVRTVDALVADQASSTWSWPDRQDRKGRQRDANLMANNLPASVWLRSGWARSADVQDNSCKAIAE